MDILFHVMGQLYYRGYNIYDLTAGFREDKRYGILRRSHFCCYFGELPNKQELQEFQQVLVKNRRLPTNFVRDVIMKAPSQDIMNSLTKSVLTLSSYDDNVTDNSIDNVMRQCLMLISVFPMLAVYGYHAYNHYECDEVFISTDRMIIFQQQRIFCVCFVRIKNILRRRQEC